MLGECMHQRLVCVGGEVVVGIHKGEILAPRLFYACVARRAKSLVCLMDGPHTWVAAVPFVAELRTPVGRSVVDEDDFHVDLLAQHAH